MAYSKKNRAVAAELIAKATQDLQFRKAFIDDPKALLTDAGAEFDDDVEIRVVENTDKIRYILLPALPSSISELTDEQMAQIAGGGGTAATVTTVVTGPAVSVTMGPAVAVTVGPVVSVTSGVAVVVAT